METGCITFATATSTPSRPTAAALRRRTPSFRQSPSKFEQLFQIRSYNYDSLSHNNSSRKNKSSLVVNALNQSLSSKGDLSNYAAPSWLPRFEELDTTNMLLRQRIIFLGTQIDDMTADFVISQLLLLDSEDQKKDIRLFINSPGGSVTAGMGIYDAMKLCKADVSTTCMGLAASMGAFLLASGTKGKRFCTKQFSDRRRFYYNVATTLRVLDGDQHDVRRPSPHHLDSKAMAHAVSNSPNLKQLRQVFSHIIQTGFLQLYPHSFHYNNISRIYIRLDSPIEALRVYIAMRRAGISPDNFTLPIVLKAATQILDRVFAEQVHGVSVKTGLESDVYCESGLISLYSKTGEFDNARKVFVNNPERKLGSWNAIIGGLSQGGRSREALHMFVEMMRAGLCPDDVTMVSVTSACGASGDFNLALQLHKCVFQAKSVAKSDILMMNSVIDMYGKCGRMDMAYEVFSKMEEKNVSSWTSMIVGYAAHGHVEDALKSFVCMREAGIRPNHVTFIGVLSACVHGGMVQQGKHYFSMMKDGYGIKPVLAHYGCMVDLLGRAGLVDEAKLMIKRMPMKANVVIWGCLMGACEKHGNVKMGEWVAKHLIELEPGNDGVFVVLSNIYASHGMWKEVEKLREVMKDRKLAKIPAYSLPAS